MIRSSLPPSLNISESGMLLESLGQVHVGEELELEFTIPGAAEPLRPARASGSQRSSGYGRQVYYLTLEARDSIRRFCGIEVKEAVAS